MKIHALGVTYEGHVVDLRGQPIDGQTVAAAVHEQRCLPAIAAPSTPAVYDYCGHVHPEMGVRTRTALAAAARSRGHETEYDDRIAQLQDQLSARDSSEPSLPAVREWVSDRTLAELRETAATKRGRLQARERLDADTDELENTVRETTRTLATRETERTAAEESRKQRRELARSYRDRVADRRRLADRLANRRRDARAELVSALSPQFAAALDAVPGPTPRDPFDAPPVPAALAILRVARTDAPIVLDADAFRNPTAAADCLGAPIIRC